MKLGKFRKGQMAVVMTLAIATLLGVMALGADVGVMYFQHMQLQKGADAAALAGASYLNESITDVTFSSSNVAPNCKNFLDDAQKAACTYAIDNGLATDANSMTMAESVPNLPTPNLQVVVNRSNLPYMFGRVIGLSTYNLAAGATAAQPGAGGAHIFPVGVQCNPVANQCTNPASNNVNLILTEKFAGNTFAPGNWAYLAPDGQGANLLGQEIGSVTGSTTQVNYLGTVNTETGNVSNSQNLENGFKARVADHNSMQGNIPGTSTACNSVSYNDVCVSHTAGAPCSGDPLSVIVPLVNFNGSNGMTALTVYGFAELYLNSAFNPKTDSSMQACFISTYDSNAVGGVAGAPNNGVLPPVALVQ